MELVARFSLPAARGFSLRFHFSMPSGCFKRLKESLMPTYLGKNWDTVTRELIRRACGEELLPATAEFQLRQFLEDGVVVIAYQRNSANRSSRGGTTSFFEVRLQDQSIATKQLTNLGPIQAPVVV
jgi:hypothetical protein